MSDEARPATPYSAHLGGRDPLSAMSDTVARIVALTEAWTPETFERPLAPGKWTARQLLTHLAQTELALGARARMALTTPRYVAQPFDQDGWIARESTLSGHDAVGVLRSLNAMNRALFASLSEADRQITLWHPEYGALTVDWIIHQLAGHQMHHLAQLEGLPGGLPR